MTVISIVFYMVHHIELAPKPGPNQGPLSLRSLEALEENIDRVVSGLPGALHSICCLGVSTTLESEKIVTMRPTND